MSWLVTGGNGFIGAHVVHALRKSGRDVVVFDDLSTGIAERVDSDIPVIRASLLDTEAVTDALGAYEVDCVLHFAAKKQPGESVRNPLLYWRENVGGLLELVTAMSAAGVRRLVYSSSASVYGDQAVEVLTEDLAPNPMSPYGETKLAGERLLADLAAATDLRYVALRYFNAAGAVSPRLADSGVFNLIPMVFEKITAGRSPLIFGTDYPTPDGTTIRDYIHVADIASAHVRAADYLVEEGDGSHVLNVGTGIGTSTREIVRTALDVSGSELTPVETDRRPGDPAVSIASAERIHQILGWKPGHDVREMMESAWEGWISAQSG